MALPKSLGQNINMIAYGILALSFAGVAFGVFDKYNEKVLTFSYVGGALSVAMIIVARII
jgi:hypothetical protein